MKHESFEPFGQTTISEARIDKAWNNYLWGLIYADLNKKGHCEIVDHCAEEREKYMDARNARQARYRTKNNGRTTNSGDDSEGERDTVTSSNQGTHGQRIDEVSAGTAINQFIRHNYGKPRTFTPRNYVSTRDRSKEIEIVTIPSTTVSEGITVDITRESETTVQDVLEYLERKGIQKEDYSLPWSLQLGEEFNCEYDDNRILDNGNVGSDGQSECSRL